MIFHRRIYGFESVLKILKVITQLSKIRKFTDETTNHDQFDYVIFSAYCIQERVHHFEPQVNINFKLKIISILLILDWKHSKYDSKNYQL